MKITAMILVGLMMLAGCGPKLLENEEKKHNKKELNDNKVGISPKAGTYKSKLWVKLDKRKNGLGSGVIMVKAPGKDKYESAESCFLTPVEENDVLTDCVKIEESGTLSYYLKNDAAKSDKDSAKYTIELETKNLSADALQTSLAPADKLDFEELETTCKINKDEIKVFIKTSNSKIKNKYGYVVFDVNSPAAGKSVVINIDNTTAAGFDIRAENDEISDYTSFMTYSTSGADGTVDPAECKIKIEKYDPLVEVNGKFTCTNLRNTSYKDPLLGKFLSIAGSWQCDDYK